MRFSPGCRCCGPPAGYIETVCCPNFIPETLWMTVSNTGAGGLTVFKACATAASFSATATYENASELGFPGIGNVFRWAPDPANCGAVTRHLVMSDGGGVCFGHNGIGSNTNWVNPSPGGAVGGWVLGMGVTSCSPFVMTGGITGSLDGVTYGNITITE